MGPITHRPMLNCEMNSKCCRCDHTAETVGGDQTNLFTRSLKRRGQARRSVQCEVQSSPTRGQPLHSGPPDAAVSGELGQTRDRGVPGQSASVELISAIAIRRLHLQRQVVRPVSQISFGRRAQTDTTDRRCTDVMKRETPRLRHGTVAVSVLRQELLFPGVCSAVLIQLAHSNLESVACFRPLYDAPKSDSLQQSAAFSAAKLCSQLSRATNSTPR